MAIQQVPQELIIEIFIWLPVNSIKRFRCLSKPLRRAIDSPGFIKSHLCKSSHYRKLIFTDDSSKKFHIYDLNLDLLRRRRDPAAEEEEIPRLQKPVSSVFREIYGYCKGMVLLNRSWAKKFRLTLWNPSIRMRKHLPDCPSVIAPNLAPNVQYYSIIGCGLGYDEYIDDFKAFYVVHILRKDGDYEIHVWIYGLKLNLWKRSQNFPYRGYSMDNVLGFPGICLFTADDGNVNWLCTLSGHGWKTEIIAFDVRKETFSLVPQPVCSINSMEGVETGLHVLEGNLCISYFCASVLPEAHLYMRRKDGADQFTWTNLYSVTESLIFEFQWFEFVKVLGYSKSGGKVLLDFGLPYMVSYDPEEQSFGKVEIEKDPNWKTPILCKESLVVLTA